MARLNPQRPAIERRTPVQPLIVRRTAGANKRVVAIALAVGISATAGFYLLTRLPELAQTSGFATVYEALIARVPDIASDRVARESREQPGSLETLIAAVRATDLVALDTALNATHRDEVNRTVDGMTALMWAASNGNEKVIRALLAHGADPNARGAHQRTALQYAADKDRRRAARLLLDAGADINGADDGSLTPLIMAADRNYTKLALLFIKRGANVNIQNIQGWTALMDAAQAGNLRLVNALLAAGARTEARHRDGSTALDFAITGKHPDIIRALGGQVPAPPRQNEVADPATADNLPGDRLSRPRKKGERQ